MVEAINYWINSVVGKWISLEMSPVRWGVFALLLALSTFAIGSSGMLPIDMSKHPKWGKALFWVGVIVAALTLFIGIIWLFSSVPDSTSTELRNMRTELNNIHNDLQEIKQILRQLN